jgi:hypothetical protein
MRGLPGPTVTIAGRSRPSLVPWIVAAASAVLAIVFGVLWATERPTSGARIEASLAPPDGHSIRVGFALSPDGRRVVMEAVHNETGVASLWVRDLANGVPVKLPGTEAGTLPFWSPDGTEVAFFADGKLKKSDLQGSTAGRSSVMRPHRGAAPGARTAQS